MASLKPVRGTHDLLPKAMRAHCSVIERARDVAERYGFEEMATPIFESSDVFRRTLGDTSDIVTKEMYTFTTKGGEEITLRPENTAGVAAQDLLRHLGMLDRGVELEIHKKMPFGESSSGECLVVTVC